MSLSRRVLSLVTLALLPAVAIQAYNEYALRAARGEAMRIARGVSADLEEVGRTARQALGILAELPPIRGSDPEACTAYLKGILDKVPGTFFFAVADARGSVLCNTLGSSAHRLSVADRRYFQDSIRTAGFAAGEPLVGRVLGKPSIQLAQAILGEGGHPTGIVFASLDLEALTARQSRIGMPPDASLTVVDRAGTVLLRLPEHEDWVGRPIPDRFRQTLADHRGDVVATDGLMGVPRILATTEAAIDDLGPATVTVGLSAAATYADIDAATRRGLILIVVGAALAVIAALLASGYFIRRPVEQLLRAAAAWGTGDLTARTGLSGPTEFGRLGAAFDAMAASLRARQVQSHRLQEQQAMMLHELNHRVRNTLSTVQALTRQARRSGDLGERLEARIIALAKTHETLSRENWEGASLLEILHGELGPFQNGGTAHFQLDGPDIHLSPRYVLALGMTFHELTANAAKYGALSVGDGRVNIRWHVQMTDKARHLMMTWQERDGPPTEKPRRIGFGLRLIRGSVEQELAGRVQTEFAPAGLCCTLSVPLDATERFTSFRSEPARGA